jgi:5-methylcytosine-specific restriction endonuclease McrA
MSSDLPQTDDRLAAIQQRDRHRCQNCFRSLGEAEQLEAHRIVPLSRGGTDRLSNYVLLCRECHRHAHVEQEVNA